MEIFFNVLNNSCKVEALQLSSIERLELALAPFMFIAWRVQMLMRLGRTCPEMDCEVMFERNEWQPAYVVVASNRCSASTSAMTRKAWWEVTALLAVIPDAMIAVFHKAHARARAQVPLSSASAVLNILRLLPAKKVHEIARSQAGSPTAIWPKSITAFNRP